MSIQLTDPLVASGLIAGGVGALAWMSASLQARALRRRIVTGTGTTAFDPATGLFSAAAALQCMRAEANRARRLQAQLRLWLVSADDAATIDSAGRDLAMTLPGAVSGIRLGRAQLCLVSCIDWTPQRHDADGARLAWSSTCIDPTSPTINDDALAWVAAQMAVPTHA